VIHFGDEVGINTEDFNGHSYAPKEKKTIIKTAGSRLKLNIISCLAKYDVMRLTTYVKSMNCRMFIKFKIIQV
jgi:hypothetical protein